MSDEPSRYCAFISYRHADKAWGDWLHKALEAYRVPRGVNADGVGADRRIGRVFRDREELAAAHDLGTEIQGALRASANLIVICSPRAAQSHWVNEEIKYWKSLGRTDRTFAIIVDGEPNAADPADECFPPALKFEVVGGDITGNLAEPIAADARDAGDGRENAKLKLIAGLLNVGFDSLRRRELEAQRRRFRRFAAIAATLVIVFAGLAAAAGWFAWQSEVQRAEAERQRVEADSQRSLAEKNLNAGIDAARAFIGNLTEDLKTAQGVQREFLVKMQQRALALLDALSNGQQLPEAGDEAKAQALIDLSAGQYEAGDTSSAMTSANQALEILQRLAKARPDNKGYVNQQPQALDLIGRIKLAWDDLEGARAAFQQSIAIHQEIAKNPDTPNEAEAIADLNAYLGDVELRGQNWAKAATVLGNVESAFRDLDGLSPAYAPLMTKECLVRAKLAFAQAKAGKIEEAGTSADNSKLCMQRVSGVVDDQEAVFYERFEGAQEIWVGDAFVALGRLDDADDAYGTADRDLSKHAQEDPSDKRLQFDMGMAKLRIAEMAPFSDNWPKTDDWAGAAVAAFAPLVEADPRNKAWAGALAEAQWVNTGVLRGVSWP